MLASLPAFVRTPLATLLIGLSTVLHTTPLIVIALIKRLLPATGLRRAADRWLVRLAESWIGFNTWLIDHATPTRFRVSGGEGLRLDGHYLILANHQSWVDIVVLQKLLSRRAPLMRFFLKSQLIWVPLLGLAWWALDFPFMKRYTRRELAKRPDLAGKDVIATRRACEKFAGMPVSIMNFVEGTRFTPEKRARQASPFRYLLKPKAGGVAFVLDAMGRGLHSIVDATIAYPAGRPTMMDLIAGRIPDVIVDIRERQIPTALLEADYEKDAASRVLFQRWLNALWAEKDALLQSWLEAPGATAPVAEARA